MEILITAGPTREPIDPVRFLSNRSSGKLGLAMAEAASWAGHSVTLLLGPGPDPSMLPASCRVRRFVTALDLQKHMDAAWPKHDLLIMAAAVTDYRPVASSAEKLERLEGKKLTLELEPTPDLVALAAETRQDHQRIVAFCLENPDQLEARAKAKLERKGVDAVVANPLKTMEADAIDALWLTTHGDREAPGSMSKPAFGRWLISRATGL